MKVELADDPLFEKKQSPFRGLKQKQLEKQRQLRLGRMNIVKQKHQLDEQIFDPLSGQLKTYQSQFSYKKTVQPSKASYNLKKYIIEQQRNLKCLRLERTQGNEKNINKGSFKFHFSKSKRKSEQKQISIPCVDTLFKNQQKEYVLYESRQMNNSLNKAIQSINNRVDQLQNFQSKILNLTHQDSNKDGKRSTVERFPLISNRQRRQSIVPQNTNNRGTIVNNDQDQEIDLMLEKRVKQSEKLRQVLLQQKKQILYNHQSRKQSSDKKGLNFFVSELKKDKKKVRLEGVRSMTYHHGSQKLSITPASVLMFELGHMISGKQSKQIQLSGLLQNSFQNRQAILQQKSNFYEQSASYNDLSASNQFRLKQIMDKKLLHRLELSKQQANKFTNYLYEIKDQYHVILNETILHILKKVRQNLLSGKVMKKSDFQCILRNIKSEELKGNPNQLIVQKLEEMMI